MKMIDGKNRFSYPHMAMHQNFLYQVTKKGEDILKQLVLDLTHGHIPAGHFTEIVLAQDP